MSRRQRLLEILAADDQARAQLANAAAQGQRDAATAGNWLALLNTGIGAATKGIGAYNDYATNEAMNQAALAAQGYTGELKPTVVPVVAVDNKPLAPKAPDAPKEAVLAGTPGISDEVPGLPAETRERQQAQIAKIRSEATAPTTEPKVETPVAVSAPVSTPGSLATQANRIAKELDPTPASEAIDPFKALRRRTAYQKTAQEEAKELVKAPEKTGNLLTDFLHDPLGIKSSAVTKAQAAAAAAIGQNRTKLDADNRALDLQTFGFQAKSKDDAVKMYQWLSEHGEKAAAEKFKQSWLQHAEENANSQKALDRDAAGQRASTMAAAQRDAASRKDSKIDEKEYHAVQAFDTAAQSIKDAVKLVKANKADVGKIASIKNDFYAALGIQGADDATLDQNLQISLSQRIHDLSGAAAAEQEVARISKQLPLRSDAPDVFMRKAENVLKALENIRRRELGYLKAQGADTTFLEGSEQNPFAPIAPPTGGFGTKWDLEQSVEQ